MALVTLNFFSEVLEMETQCTVILPQGACMGQIGLKNAESAGGFPCLYLLHGLSDDHTMILRRTCIDRYAAEQGICVVMPSGGKSFYCDQVNGLKYYTYISQELPRRIREFFRVSTAREDSYIAGISMGGYGALKIAMQNPEVFSAAAALSPVGDLRHPAFDYLLPSLFGSKEIPDHADLHAIARAHREDGVKSRLFITIGTEDFLYDTVQPLRTVLPENGYSLTYQEQPGEHSWDLWESRLRMILKWLKTADTGL